MSDIKPLVIVLDDRFNGMYSGGKWTAWNMCYVPSKIFGDEKECSDFFSTPNLIYGRGETPQDAIDDLKYFIEYGNHMTIERIKPVSESNEEEEEKMEPTSVWKIEDIDDICMSQEGDKMYLELKNKDDLTKIILTGEAIRNHNDNIVAILIDDYNKLLEKIEKLRRENEEFEEEVSHWKKEAADCLKLRDEAQKEAYKLKKKNEEYEEKIKKLEHDDMLDKNAADYWSKEHDTLLKRFAKLQVENEKLKRLNTPTIENFTDEEPTDNVNHPSHYTGKYECIDVMQDVFGDEATNDFCLCNAFKYIWRAHKKNGLEDVKKARWYLNKYVEEAEKDGVSKGK